MEERSPAASYLQARAAAEAGAFDRASAGFAAALAAAPEDDLVASRALSHAIAAGDWPLAVAAARVIERADALLPDGRFLLITEAIRAGNWADVERQLAIVEEDGLFAFTVPVLRAWIARETGAGDPLQILAAGAEIAGAPGYIAEQRPLLLAADGKAADAAALLADGALGARAERLRIAAAAALAARGDRESALSLLTDGGAPASAARRLVEEGKKVPGAIDGPASGAAELFVALALDLDREQLRELAIVFARLATWLAPESSESWLVAGELIAAEGRPAAALPLLDAIAPDDPYADLARGQRIRFLAQSGREAAAAAEAKAAAYAPGAGVEDWVRLGELYAGLGRHGEAALAFGHALQVRAEGDARDWPLWLMRGSSYHQAGDWPNALASLHQAYRLAPGQALVLNYLGYSLLERGERTAEAERLIREAHRLAPESAAIADSLGWAHYLRGEYGRAIELLETAVHGEPADVEINEHLGDAYYAAGRRIEARYAWRAALVHAEEEDRRRLHGKIERGLEPRLAGR